MRNWIHPIILLGALLPLLLLVAVVIQEGSNTPFLDQWDTSLRIALDTIHGNLSPATLVLPHGDHRIVFTNLVTIVSARLFHWNLYLELFVTIGLAVALLLLVLKLVRREFPQVVYIVLIPISSLIFSLRGRHTWMTSFQSCFLFVTLFFLLGLWTLMRGKVGWRSLLIATFFAVCCTFSLANGIIAWFLLFVALLVLGYRKPAYLIFWIAAAAVSIFLYYSPPYPIAISRPSLLDLPAVVQYALVYLGGMFRPETEDAITLQMIILITLASIVLFLANAWVLWRQKRSLSPLLPWLLIGAYSAGTAVLTGFGRVTLPLGQALSERYVIMAIFWWISLIVLGAAVIHALSQNVHLRRSYHLLRFVNVAFFLALALLMIRATDYHNRNIKIVNPIAETCYPQYLITQDPDLACLRMVRMDLPYKWLPRVAPVAQERLAIFSTVPLSVTLNDLPFDPIQIAVPEPGYETYDSGGVALPAFFEHAPAQVEYALVLPPFYPDAEFTASLYLDPSNVLKDPGTIQDGVLFSVTVTGENGDTRRSDAVRFDPHTMSDPIPFQFDLTDYVGQPIHLRLQTESLASVAYDWALWIDPTIRLSDTMPGS
ncbi:MAG: hypothetical protein ABI835_04370 [Chloroflexota bacterium]